MSTRSKGRARLGIRYFDDRILLTETHAWAYYRLPTHAYEFLTPAEREGMAINITVALSAIRLPDTEVHLRQGACDLVAQGPVGGVVVLAAEEVVVDAGYVRRRGFHGCSTPIGW